ncbi:MAG: Lrp/AsnC family transcriptional regulator [Fimbriimonadaceae bacterium]
MLDGLDQVDTHILRLLQENGRITNADLARKVGLSPPSVLQRVRKLEELGYILGYQANLNARRLGYDLVVVVMISLALHQEQPIERFRKAVQEIPEVIECLHVSGDFDFLLKVIAKDISSYEQIVREKISRIKGIGRIQSSFVLSFAKQESAFPLNHLGGKGT